MQTTVKQFLCPFWQGDMVYEEFPVFGTRMRLDLFNASLMVAIEVNGDQHIGYSPYFHGNSRANYFFQLKRDQRKFEWCEINKIKLVEVYQKDFPLTRQFFKQQGAILV